MTLGGGDISPPGSTSLEHAGVKGMRWGVRKTPAQRAASDKARAAKKAVKASDKEQFKIASKMNGGEAVAAALVGGPIGLLGYKAIKRNAAKSKLKNKNLSDEEQTSAASKLRLGEAIAVTVVSSPVGLAVYAVAKNVAANQVEEFK